MAQSAEIHPAAEKQQARSGHQRRLSRTLLLLPLLVVTVFIAAQIGLRATYVDGLPVQISLLTTVDYRPWATERFNRVAPVLGTLIVEEFEVSATAAVQTPDQERSATNLMVVQQPSSTNTQTASPTTTSTSTPQPSATFLPSSTASPTSTETQTPRPTASWTHSLTPTSTASSTFTPSSTYTPTLTFTPSFTYFILPTATPTPFIFVPPTPVPPTLTLIPPPTALPTATFTHTPRPPTRTRTPTSTSIPPPVAAFDALPESGVAPLLVNFVNRSSGVINSWQWEFGDGGGINTPGNPSNTYQNPGTYRVRLTVTGPGGSNVAERDIVVLPPASDLAVTHTADNLSPAEGDTVIYTTTVTNDGPSPLLGGGTVALDLQPTSLEYLSDDSGGAFNPATNVWTLISADPGGVQTLNITVRVRPGTSTQSIITSATITASSPPDPDATNNTDDETVSVS